MTKLMPYGSAEHAANVSKVGTSKKAVSLADRVRTAEGAAKVGDSKIWPDVQVRRVVRLNAA